MSENKLFVERRLMVWIKRFGEETMDVLPFDEPGRPSFGTLGDSAFYHIVSEDKRRNLWINMQNVEKLTTTILDGPFEYGT